MAKTKQLIILIGNIGSGKSTLARKYIERGYVAIARDYIRYAIGEGKYVFNPQFEPIIWKVEQYMFNRFIELGVNIVVDEVGVSRRMRKAYIPYAKENNYKIIAIVLPRYTQEEAVNHRMKDPHGQNNKQLWENVWEKFDAIYTKPTKEEGFDEIKFLTKRYMKRIVK